MNRNFISIVILKFAGIISQVIKKVFAISLISQHYTSNLICHLIKTCYCRWIYQLILHLKQSFTGTFFCTHPTTQSAPRNAMAVNPHEVTALKAYSEVKEGITDLVKSSFGSKYFSGLL